MGNATQGGYVTVASLIGTPPAFVRKGSTWEGSLRGALKSAGVAQ